MKLRVGHRVWVVLATMGILGCCIAYYFLVIVKAREDDFISKKFRVLAQIGTNIQDKQAQLDGIAFNNFTGINNNPSRKFLDAPIAISVFEKYFAPFTGSYRSDNKENPDSLYTFHKLTTAKGTGFLVQAISTKDFFSSLRRPEDFEHLIIFSEKTSVSAKGETIRDFNIRYRTFSPSIRIIRPDSIFKSRDGIWISQMGSLEIDGVHYRTFSQGINAPHGETWIITGLVPESYFRAQTRSISVWSIANLSLLVLFLILGMPLIKLSVMNSAERLPVSTVWFTGMSIVVGTSVLTMLILSVFDYYQDRDTQRSKLGCLADNVSQRFQDELKTIHSQLVAVQNQSQPNGKRYADAVLNDTSWQKKFSQYPFFNEVTWLDSYGNIKYVLFSTPIDPVLTFPNLYQRDYVRNVIEGKTMNLYETDNPFSLQSISSLLDNKAEAGFGIPLKNNSDLKVQAMATRLRSVMDVLLPEGYVFCITDESGQVQFHSQSSYNLKENIIEETSEEKLKFAIQSRINFDGDVRYHNSLFVARGIPVTNLPYYLVVLKDKTVDTAPLTLTISFTAIFMLVFFMIVGLQLLMLFAVTRRYTRLHLRRFFLHWMRPRENEEYKLVFHQLSASFLVAIAMEVIGIVWYYRDPAMLFCFLVSPIIVGAWVYGQVKFVKVRKDYWLTFVFIGLSFTFLLLLNIFFWNKMDLGLKSTAYQIGFVCILASGKLIQSVQFRKNAYEIMLFLWLMAGSIMPVYFLFKAGHYHQNVVWYRYQLHQALRQSTVYEQQEYAKLARMLPNSKTPLESSIQSTLAIGNYLKNLNGYCKVDKCPKERTESEFTSIIQAMYTPYDSLFFKGFTGTNMRSTDRSWTTTIRNDTLYMTMTGGPNPSFLAMHIPHRHFILTNTKYSLLFVVTVIIGLISVFRILGFAVKRIYGVEWYKNEISVIQRDQLAQEVKQNKKVILVSLPGSDLDGYLTFAMNDLRLIPRTLNFINQTELGDGIQNHNTVILKQLDFGLSNRPLLRKKLEILKSLQSTSDTVIITSAIHPSFIYEMFDKFIAELSSKKLDEKLRREYLNARTELRQWKTVLGEYTVIYLPLEFTYRGSVTTLDDWLAREMSIGRFLPSLMPSLRKQVQGIDDWEDQALLVEARCRAYYESIWNCLSRNERFLLYDLARDRYMNYKNKRFIHHLMNLGIIRKEDTLRTMNDSFGQFVLTAMKEDDELEMDRESRRKGTWSSVQLVLLIVVIGLGLFLALSQEALFNRLNTVLTASAALVAVLLRFGGFFGGADKSEVKT